jgi:outer membrane protein OmpA-like peptidoglycan-associated protein
LRNLLFILLLTLLSAITKAQPLYEVLPINDINTTYREYGVKPYKDGIIFCSNRKTQSLISYVNETTLEPITQLYYSEKRNNGFKIPMRFVIPTLKITDEGPFEFLNDKEIYFTRSYIGDDGPVLGIFYSRLVNGEWTEPISFIHNLPSCNVAYPSISPDGNRMYFSAAYPGGFGKSDIYYVDKIDGGWSKPVNAGSIINSAYSELFPTVHSDGSISFSSNRPDVLKGLNLFRSLRDSIDFSPPTLLPEPINSQADDFSFHLSASEEQGFVSSNRSGNDDVFEVKMTRPYFEEIKIQEKNSYCYHFFDETEYQVDSLPLRYEWEFEDGTKIRAAEADYCFATPGNYTVKLNIIDTLTNDLFFSQGEFVVEVLDIEQPYIECPDTIETGSAVKLHGRNSYLPGFDIGTYHWFIENNYLKGEEITYTFPKDGPYKIVMGLRSLPDSLGLVSQKAVEKTVIAITGYEEKPEIFQSIASSPSVQTNDIYEYIPDSLKFNSALPEETIFRVEILKSQERVSELDTVFDNMRGLYPLFESYIQKDSLYSYAAGESENLEDTYSIFKDLKDKHYENAEVKAYRPKSVLNLDSLDNISEEDLRKAVLRTGNVFFPKNEYTLQAGSELVLDKVIRLMKKYPSLLIQISAHTDDSGTLEHNLKLSERRANSVLNYFIQNGIPKERLKSVGFGTQKPIADNSTEEGKRQNRRVEFETIDNTN